MTDLEALYRAVLARPEEDMPRLAYADEVGERGDPARAEFIRAHIGRANFIARKHGISYRECPVTAGDASARCAECHESVALEMRAYHELLKDNRERWEPACVACGGEKYARLAHGTITSGKTTLPVTRVRYQCPACKGTGRQPCRWERGFPVVEVAEMRQVWQLGKCPKCAGAGEIKYAVPELGEKYERLGRWRAETRKCEACSAGAAWRPTPWLCDAIRTHHVAGVEVLYHRPLECHHGYAWESHANPVSHTPRVPWPVHGHCSGIYGTLEEATAALARAVVLAALEWLDAQGAK